MLSDKEELPLQQLRLLKWKAGGADVAYMVSTGTNSEREVMLSQAVGSARALETAKRIRGLKGYSGGRFYINEWRAMFAPVKEFGEYKYIYPVDRGPSLVPQT